MWSETRDRSSTLSLINASRVLQTIWLRGEISRVDIARTLGLNKSTITKIVGDLLDAGIICTVAEGEAGPTGGRRPQYLTISKDYGCIVGLEIQTEHYTAVAIDLHGEVVYKRTEEIDITAQPLSELALSAVENTRSELTRRGHTVLGVGLGLSGIINPHDGVIYKSNPLSVTEPVRIYEEMAGRLPLPVMVENDANCCCWGELAFRHSDRPSNFLFVLGEVRFPTALGSDFRSISIGLGVVIGGRVHRGDDYSAGEFKSILWSPGNTTQFSIADEEFAAAGDRCALTQRMLCELGGHVAFLVNSLNLSAVVVGGSIEQFREDLVSIFEDEIQRNWSYDDPVQCRIRFSSLGEDSVAYGAAGMFLEHLFSLPGVDGSDASPRGMEMLQRVRRARRQEEGHASARQF